jgi:hypothetical protein
MKSETYKLAIAPKEILGDFEAAVGARRQI